MICPWRLSERRIRSLGDAGGVAPEVDRLLDPGRDGDRAQAAVLAAQIDDHPAAVALLDVVDRQRHGFAAAQAAADEQRQQGAIAFAFQGGGIGAVDERLGLRPGQPVPCPGPLLLHARAPGRCAAATAASSSPLAAASRASFLIAARRWLMVEGA